MIDLRSDSITTSTDAMRRAVTHRDVTGEQVERAVEIIRDACRS